MNSKPSTKNRFLGWQNTPIQQASFGSSTRGGSYNHRFKMKHSTGDVQEVAMSWYLLDASKLPVGRLASLAATLLMGKHKPTFTPGAGSGDGVVIVNAEKAFFTSNKAEKKVYYRHTGFVGGLKMQTAGEALSKDPAKVLHDAVQGMMPKNRLSRYQLSRLKVYLGAEHPMKAQKPQEINLEQKSILKNVGKVA